MIHSGFRRLAVCAALLAFCAPPLAVAAQGEIEEVVVTGSYIRGTPEDAASPVDVTTREEMDFTGNPSILEMIRNLGPVSGIDGETNQFQSNGLEGVSNINMRGLGPGRTLVLVNGTRMAPNPYFVAESGQQFVNTNAIPAIALSRIELLKDGASATYGSDAISGVANFITRSDFRGVEFQGSFKGIPDSEDDGDYDAGLILGFGTDRVDVVTSFGYQFRTEVQVREKDWALGPIENNPRGGFSTIGSPGTYYAFDFSAVAADPDCETVGGHLAAGVCNFRFTDFDNISEEEEHLQWFTEVNVELTDTLNWHTEFLYSNDEVPEWNTSPSYPPQTLFGVDRALVPGMPHFDDFLARNPDLAATSLAGGFIVRGRFQGVSGPAQVGNREVDFYRLSTGLEGQFDDGTFWNFDVSYSTAEGERNTNDSRIDRVAYAYRGLGGPDCDIATGVPGSGNLGTGDCWFYNPLTSGYTESQSATATSTPPPGSENSQLNNPDFMQDWMTDFVGTEVTTELFVVDLVFSGDSGVSAAGGNVGWAAGLQYRRDDYELDPNQVTDVTQTPCPFGIAAGESFTIPAIDIGGGNFAPPFTYDCPGNGPFHFLAGALPFETDEDVLAAFGELNVPLTENLEAQIAVRYEDYGGAVGDTLDPKVAVRWDVTPAVTLRGSLSSSFRGPSLNQLGGRFTSLQFVTSELAFKAIDTDGNPDLDPEAAITTNFGVIFQPNDNLFMSLDYWNFDFSNPIVLENFGDVIAAAQDPSSPINDLGLSKVTFQTPGDPSSGVERVSVTYQNGPEIETDGLDYKIEYTFDPTDAGVFTIGTQGTLINSYEVGSWIYADGFDAEGDLNRFENIARPLPEWKNNAWVNWEMGGHNLRLETFYTSDYDDKTEPAGQDWGIDDFTTFDLHYNLRFLNDNARIFASVYNLTDEDPPFARLDLNYDPYTHNPFGRMVKVGVTYRFAGGLFQ